MFWTRGISVTDIGNFLLKVEETVEKTSAGSRSKGKRHHRVYSTPIPQCDGSHSKELEKRNRCSYGIEINFSYRMKHTENCIEWFLCGDKLPILRCKSEEAFQARLPKGRKLNIKFYRQSLPGSWVYHPFRKNEIKSIVLREHTKYWCIVWKKAFDFIEYYIRERNRSNEY